MIANLFLLIIGLFFLVKGADIFVDSSVNIARISKIPKIIIGATIVSVATTLPEVTVSSFASWQGQTGLAIGNAVGSCIANIGLIVGLICLVRGALVFKKDEIIFSLRFMLVASFIIFILTLPLIVYRAYGFLLIASAVVFLILNLKKRKGINQAKDFKAPDKRDSLPKCIFFFIIGALLILLGSRLLVSSVVVIAHFLGISPTVIGLTIASVGTSLPELVTAFTSAKKNNADLSLGNIIGANVLNMTLVIGAASSINPLNLSRFTQVYSISAMLLMNFILAFFILRRKQLRHKEGRVIFSLYVIYIFGLVIATLAGIR